MMRTLTTEEQAFLAWFFVEMDTATAAERFDMDAQQMLGQWQEMTSNELDDDFISFVHGIHGVQ